MLFVYNQEFRKATEFAVAEYGIENLSMEKISELTQIRESLLRDSFVSKDYLLLQVYLSENNEMSSAISKEIDNELDGCDSLEEKVRLCLETIWDELLSDSDRLSFFEGFYRADYCGMAAWGRNYAVNTLAEELAYRLEISDDYRQSLYDACSVLYEAAHSVVSGKDKNTGECRNRLLDSALTILKSGSEIQTA